jgi:hypothetical protein
MIKLQVANARPEDSGRGIAHLPRSVLSALGLSDGDVVEIVGKKTTPARAVGPYAEDEGLEIIRPSLEDVYLKLVAGHVGSSAQSAEIIEEELA